jgi:hypothetical protein
MAITRSSRSACSRVAASSASRSRIWRVMRTISQPIMAVEMTKISHMPPVQAGGTRASAIGKRYEIQHQQRIGGDGHGGDGGDAARRQGQGGDGDRGQQQRNQRIGGAAAEEDDGRQGADIEQQLDEQLAGAGGLAVRHAIGRWH